MASLGPQFQLLPQWSARPRIQRRGQDRAGPSLNQRSQRTHGGVGEHPTAVQLPGLREGTPQLPETAPRRDTKTGLPSDESSLERAVVTHLHPEMDGESKENDGCLDSRAGPRSPNEESTERDAVAMEMQRRNFRQFSYQEAKGPREACSQLWYLCHRWLKPERHTKEQILELLILEQFLAILPPEIQGWVKGRGSYTCSQAVALAEEFSLRQREAEISEGQVVLAPAPEARVAPSDAREVQRSPEVQGEGGKDDGSLDDGWLNISHLKSPKEVELRGSCETTRSFQCQDAPINSSVHLCAEAKSPWSHLGESVNNSKKISHDQHESASQQMLPKGKKQRTCSVCGKSFSRSTGLIAHQRIHTGEKPYGCSDCGKTFTLRSNLIAHERTHNGEKPYQCHECGKRFSVSSQLTKHERTHSGEKPYQCTDCGQTFRQSSHLKNHQRIHTGDRPFKCSDCGKSFSVSSDLIRHEISHTGEKPYQCPDCGKRFCNSSQIITHRRVHTGEKPYKCLECGKGFTVSQQLSRHQRVHTGEKPYKCPECGKMFGVSTLLTGHLRIHTGEKPYECSECAKSFRLRSNLIAHQKIHTARKS